MLQKNLLFSFFLLCTVFSVNRAVGQFSISGKVVDSSSGQSLSAAGVSINGTTQSGSYTNEEGSFQINDLPKGNYILTVTYLGYQSLKKKIYLNQDKSLHLSLKHIGLFIDPIEVKSTRAGEKDPFTKTNISSEELSKNNLGQDLPYLLKNQPSLLTTSDAGAGVGYTNLWIRGSDVTRINVTFNGIPVNDAESQGAFFVDIPDIASSANSIQIQRGVGTSTNGAGAFGATINLSTNTFHADPYGKISTTYGSFNTKKATVEAGTGLLNDHFTVDARLSYLSSDGFIDRASSNLKSFYLSTAYFNKKTAIRFNVFSGKEKTYQAWNGVPEDSLKAGNRTFNGLGRMPNGKYYKNQTDNYTQTYYQLFWNQEINTHWDFNIAAFLTRGKGYYEEYKIGQSYGDYGLPNPVIHQDTLKSTDLIRDRWLDNYYYGTVFSLNYQTSGFKTTLGGGWNKYEGKHYGNIVWAKYGIDKDLQYYFNDAFKKDFNIYWKGNKELAAGLNAFLDLQYQHISYQINGFSDHPDLHQDNQYDFFNPKAGLNYQPDRHNHFYISYAIAHKSPNRDDYEVNIQNTPQPEQLSDWEAGYDRSGSFYHLHANLYYMQYKNQLALTGEINYEGTYTRTNVPKSYRAGIEINGDLTFAQIFKLSAHAAISKNRIQDYTSYVDDYDHGGQKEIHLGSVPISFSPQVIAGGTLSVHPFNHFNAGLTTKYVGKRYLDNTGSEDRMLDDYLINGVTLHYAWQPKGIQSVDFHLKINNLFDVKYVTNGYTYASYQGGKIESSNSYFPQAGINFLFGVDIKF